MFLESFVTLLTTLGAGAFLWIAGRTFDRFLQWAFGKKVLDPLWEGIKWRYRAFRTRGNPIEATFETSYTPSGNYTVNQGKELVSRGLEKAETASKGRLDLGTLSWDADGVGVGFVEADHVECQHPFKVRVELHDDAGDLPQSAGKPFGEHQLDYVHFKIRFKFAFHQLDETIQNLGASASFLSKGMRSAARGTLSSGQFIIHPVESDLTLDEWIKNEGFEVSLLLAGEGQHGGSTEVEFFPDRAEIHPPHLEIDSETTRYIRLLILNYYLRKS